MVGAGFGGLTAAVYAALQGAKVLVLEKESRPLNRFRESDRYIHPRMYDWPRPGWDIDDAALPVLNWKAGRASQVISKIESELDIATANFGVSIQSSAAVKAIDGSAKAAWVRWSDGEGSFYEREVDVIIVAIGFGEERFKYPVPAGEAPIQQYWQLRKPETSFCPIGRNDLLQIVGNGDGALADLIGLAAGTTADTSDVFLGNFVPLLARFESNGVRQSVLELEQSLQYALVVGSDVKEREYESRLRSLVKPVLREFSTDRKIRMQGRSAHVLDLHGTYPANRALFVALHEPECIEYSKSEKGDSAGRWPYIKKNGLKYGPFQAGDLPDSWVLLRPGPVDPMESSFPAFFSAISEAQWRGRLALSERAISAAWSRRVKWSSASGPPRRQLPRLLLSSEWTDSYVQWMMHSIDHQRAARVLAAILRLHSLLFDEVCLSDAEVIDGKLLLTSLKMLTNAEQAAFSVYARASTLLEAAKQFLTTQDLGNSGRLIGRHVELSVLEGSEPPFAGRSVSGQTTDDVLDEISTHESMAELVSNIRDAQKLLGSRVRAIPGGTRLFTVAPQSGLLEDLAAGRCGDVAEGIFQRRTDGSAATRTEVFNTLKRIAGISNVFLAAEPQWLAKVASWYNTAYKTAVARKNGCTAFEMLWTCGVQRSVSGERIHNKGALDLESFMKQREWDDAARRVSSGVASWRRGVLPVAEVISSIPGGSTLECDEEQFLHVGDIWTRLDKALRASTLDIVELYNTHPEPYSPDRTIMLVAGGVVLSTILIGR